MDRQDIIDILKQIESGNLTSEQAILKLRTAPFENLEFAKPDTHRSLRQGIPEIIYGQGKNSSQIIDITKALIKSGQKTVLITRLSNDKANTISNEVELKYYETARIGIVGEFSEPSGNGNIVVATGGTSDLPVAEEAALTAEALGNNVVRLYDVGVAGLHRLLSHVDTIMSASVIIAIAGMEGALASVIGGLADCPVIGVPTSVGYGAAFDGLSALLSMLNSCASGVSVVNIDNGFGAGYLASMINHIGQRS